MVDCTVMLKACYGSDQQRDLIERTMPEAGVEPDVFVYTTLVGQLMVEGDREAAEKVVEEEMPAAGVVPNDRTAATLALSGDTLSIRRTQFLNHCIRKGGDEATAAAWTLLEKLVERREADVFQFNTMLKACHDSDQQRELIDVMKKKAGIMPNAPMFNALISGLLIEGDREAAVKVVSGGKI